MGDNPRLGCQVLTWPAAGRTVGDACQDIADCGYDGIEIGYRFLREQPDSYLSGLLADHKLQLAAIHCIAPWHEGQSEEAVALVQRAAALAAPHGGVLLASMPTVVADDPDATSRANETLRRAHQLAADAGLAVYYHNHVGDFQRPDYFERLTEGLDLAVDVANLYQAGQDVPARLREWGERVRYLHFRNVRNGERVPLVAEGEIPIPVCLQAATRASWHVVEMEVGLGSTVNGFGDGLGAAVTDWARQNRDYLAAQQPVGKP